MKFRKSVRITALFLLFFGLPEIDLISQTPAFPHYTLDKKIICLQGANYWDWSADLAVNLGQMQADRPYMNGVVFHTGANYGQANYAFNDEVWSDSILRFDELRIIAGKWTTLTDNFILVWGHARNTDPDFFNDTLWTRIIKNAEIMGKAVKTAHCKGILFDPEFYSHTYTYSPWCYSKIGEQGFKAPYMDRGQGFNEVCSKARQRGREYVQALQLEMPKIIIMTTFLYGGVWNYCYNDMGSLPDSKYALLAAFADGMVEGLNPGSQLIDGNESSFYVDDTRQFYLQTPVESDYYTLRILAPSDVVDSTVLPKWNLQGQIAMSVYFDFVYNIYEPKTWSTPEYQSKWMIHNVYHSLLSTDQYVWFYTEDVNFWTGENAPSGTEPFNDLEEAIGKFRSGEPLGYDMHEPPSGNGQSDFYYSPETTIIVSQDDMIPGNALFTPVINPGSNVLKVDYFANSLLIGSSWTSPFSISHKLADSTYAIVARTYLKNGQHNTSAPLYIIDGILPVATSADNPENSDFYIYPNPASRGTVNIDINGNINGNSIIKVINLSGQVVFRHETPGSEKKIRIPVESFGGRGLFIMQIENSRMIQNLKVTIL